MLFQSQLLHRIMLSAPSTAAFGIFSSGNLYVLGEHYSLLSEHNIVMTFHITHQAR